MLRMTNTKPISRPLWLLIGLLVLVACSPQVVPVYVTPTQPADVTEETVGAVDTAAGDATGSAAETGTPEAEPAGESQPLPTASPTATLRADVTPLIIGAVVGPDSPPASPPPSGTPAVTATTAATAVPATATSAPLTGTPPTAPLVVSPSPAGPTATPFPRLEAVRMGIQIDTYLERDDWNLALYQAQQLNVGWVKFQVDWSLLQPGGPQDVGEQFRRFEIYVEEAHNRGFYVLLSVAKAPNWARSSVDQHGPPDDPQALANFISLMLQEFGSSVSAIEVWNEPNLIREWTGQPQTGQRYMAYFAPAYNAVRAYSPFITVVTAGLAPASEIAGASRDDRAFLNEMYAGGLGNYQNDPALAVGVHPYGWGNPPDARCCDLSAERGWDDNPHFFFLDNLIETRQIMNANGHSAVPLWATEFGWATWERLPGDPPDEWMRYNSEQAQMAYTLRAFEIGQTNTDLNVGLMVLWNLNFANSVLIEQRDERAGYGIVLPPGYDPLERPLFWALVQTLQGQPRRQ